MYAVAGVGEVAGDALGHALTVYPGPASRGATPVSREDVLPAGATSASALLTGVSGVEGIGASREPAGGSPTGQPTGPVVAQVAVG